MIFLFFFSFECCDKINKFSFLFCKHGCFVELRIHWRPKIAYLTYGRPWFVNELWFVFNKSNSQLWVYNVKKASLWGPLHAWKKSSSFKIYSIYNTLEILLPFVWWRREDVAYHIFTLKNIPHCIKILHYNMSIK